MFSARGVNRINNGLGTLRCNLIYEALYLGLHEKWDVLRFHSGVHDREQCNVADLMQGATGGIQVISAPNVAPVPVAYTADDLQAAYQLGVEDGKKGQSLDVKA